MILLAYGTRPEYIKIRPLIHEFDFNSYPYKTLFTGQHKDLLKEHKADYHMNIIDGDNRLDSIVQSVMNCNEINNVIKNDGITHILVQGDTTTAFAIALFGFHRGIKIIHLEAGLRTYDNNNPYPEEANRRMISQIADIHLCPTDHAKVNLLSENIMKNVFVVGNTVIDNLLPYKEKCKYTNKILVTMHRRENHHWIKEWFEEIDKLASEYPEYEFIIPLHPNPNVQKYKYILKHLTIINPLPYEEMLELLVETRLVITDSGGLQEECSFFNKKCLTCRIVTERPEAIGQSTIMVDNPSQLNKLFNQNIDDYVINYKSPFGDGHAAEKILLKLKEVI